MPRKPRIEYAGAVYHLMSRGNHQESIYRDDRDCTTFIETLEEVCAKTGWRVHAYVLMGNHYHLLVETPVANLVVGMKWLQGTYTQRFNARHKLWGHLLQGRYKALLVDPDGGEYFSTIANYVHLNPARAKLFDLQAGELTDYRWSSYPLYLRANQRPEWLVTDRVLGELGVRDDRAGRSWYRRYMSQRVAEVREASQSHTADERWADIRRGWCLGSESFRNGLLQRLDKVLEKTQRKSLHGEEMGRHAEIQAERLLQAGVERLGVAAADFSGQPKGADGKAVLAWYLRKNTTIGRAWVAQRLVLGDESRVTKLVRAVDRESCYAKLKAKLANS